MRQIFTSLFSLLFFVGFGQTTITGTGTIILTAGQQAKIELWGGGGGGGGANDQNMGDPRAVGGGGGGGQYNSITISGPANFMYSVSTGSGGSASNPNGGVTAGSGGNSTFQVLSLGINITAAGGLGGGDGVVTAAGVCSVCPGLGSGNGGTSSYSGTGTIGTTVSGPGGAGLNGGGAGQPGVGVAVNADDAALVKAMIPGGGGAGGFAAGSTTANNRRRGGVGAAGLVQYTIISPTPITLKSFTATKKENKSHIEWITSSETNNEMFYVQRSSNGSNFDIIDRQRGAGNSSAELSYSFVDESPLDGVNYYRLKQVDFDGTSSLSKIESVQHSLGSQIKVIQNPAENKLAIHSELENYTVSILNTVGQEVKKVSRLALTQSIDIQDLQSGIHYVMIKSDGALLKSVKIFKD
jgi:hypothetical protein